MQPEFVVGYGNKDYPGYQKLTEAQLLDRAIRQRLLEMHARHAGFPLAEPTLLVKGVLRVVDGCVLIDGSSVTVVGKVPGQDLTIRGVYAAVYWNKLGQIAWTQTLPPLDGDWSVGAISIRDAPCLFIRSVRCILSSVPSHFYVLWFFLLVYFMNLNIVFVDRHACCLSQA